MNIGMQRPSGSLAAVSFLRKLNSSPPWWHRSRSHHVGTRAPVSWHPHQHLLLPAFCSSYGPCAFSFAHLFGSLGLECVSGWQHTGMLHFRPFCPFLSEHLVHLHLEDKLTSTLLLFVFYTSHGFCPSFPAALSSSVFNWLFALKCFNAFLISFCVHSLAILLCLLYGLYTTYKLQQHTNTLLLYGSISTPCICCHKITSYTLCACKHTSVHYIM